MAGNVPDWVPLNDVLKQFGSDEMETMYPGIYEKMGYLPYVKFDTSGNAFIRSPDIVKNAADSVASSSASGAKKAAQVLLKQLGPNDNVAKPKSQMTKDDMVALAKKAVAGGLGAKSSPGAQPQAQAAAAPQRPKVTIGMPQIQQPPRVSVGTPQVSYPPQVSVGTPQVSYPPQVQIGMPQIMPSPAPGPSPQAAPAPNPQLLAAIQASMQNPQGSQGGGQ